MTRLLPLNMEHKMILSDKKKCKEFKVILKNMS